VWLFIRAIRLIGGHHQNAPEFISGDSYFLSSDVIGILVMMQKLG
jgi:hypothetical protein